MPLSGKTSMNPVMANARLNMLVLKWNLMRLLFCVRVDLKAVFDGVCAKALPHSSTKKARTETARATLVMYRSVCEANVRSPS